MKRLAGLRSLPLSDRYRSDQEDVVKTFFVPAFTVASSYSRAVGYFTSTSLALYARGIETFAARGGSMRLIASPHLNEDDVVDIERGYDVRAVLERATMRELEQDQPETVLDGLGLLGRLIAEGRLDIKLAFVAAGGPRRDLPREDRHLPRRPWRLGRLHRQQQRDLRRPHGQLRVGRGVPGLGCRRRHAGAATRGRLPGAVVQPDPPPLRSSGSRTWPASGWSSSAVTGHAAIFRERTTR